MIIMASARNANACHPTSWPPSAANAPASAANASNAGPLTRNVAKSVTCTVTTPDHGAWPSFPKMSVPACASSLWGKSQAESRRCAAIQS